VGLAPQGQVSRGLALTVVAAILVVGAIMEELLFRSYAFFRMVESFTNLLRAVMPSLDSPRAQLIGSWIALLLINGMFGAAHLRNPNATFWGFANTVLIGVFFGIVMLRTASLWLLWGIHFGWNFTLGGLYGLPVSGFNLFSVWTQGKLSGPRWLTGGDYGIEASAITTIGILLMLIVVMVLRRPATADLISSIQSE
jgi:membrane protease YdiL (CAAX protease family)